MNFDYALILIVITLACGVVWLIDHFTGAKKRQAALDNLLAQHPDADEKTRAAVAQEPIIVDWAKSFFPILIVIIVFRSFLFEPFRIPSGSMKPTLLVGDFILVNKYRYGLRLPVTGTKIWENTLPERGDIVVFKAPHKPNKEDYIKRVIGLPGDRILYTRDKDVIIIPACNQLAEIPADCPKSLRITPKMLAVGGFDDSDGDESENPVDLLEEDIGELKHQLLHNPRNNLNFDPYYQRYRFTNVIVPEGHYFVMGDNRDNSADSRVWGFVPEENLVGEAVAIWMHINFDSGIKLNRIGSIE